PPFGPGLAPGATAWRPRDAVVGARCDHVYNRVLGTVNELRARLGLEPVRHVHAQQYLLADRTILFTAEPFEYPRERWPGGFRLVGPALWEPASAGSFDPPDGAPVVLVTASTAYQADERLISTALAALAGEPVRVVVTTGAHDPAGFRPPANAVVQRFVPHSAVLPHAACVVSHGGMGITQKALARGVPVCVVPFARDQFEVARRVEVCGAGARLPARRLSARRLRRAVRAASGRRAGAERVAEAFARAGGARAAADAVEDLVR
ncbi:MAG TPA: nucleotide disphospho-sugar-binding domain-containing protein, partial [Solirubrobacteraceae bacterium]|nr:nucleotide disphospho-sugar-binding domain-containing protein [Solirubrobacteraceae bacterium]